MKILLSVAVMDHDGLRPESSDKRLFIKNIEWNVTHEEFQSVCTQQVDGVKLVEFLKSSKGKFIGSAIVDFDTHENAMAAIPALHQYPFNDRKIIVIEDTLKRNPEGQSYYIE